MSTGSSVRNVALPTGSLGETLVVAAEAAIQAAESDHKVLISVRICEFGRLHDPRSFNRIPVDRQSCGLVTTPRYAARMTCFSAKVFFQAS